MFMNLKFHESYTAEVTKVFQLQWFHTVAQYEKTIMKSGQVRIWKNVVGSHIVPSLFWHFPVETEETISF
jgi:hypothetical protein